MLTPKDYKAIAAILNRRFVPADVRFSTQEYIGSFAIEELADYMAQDNPNFNRDKFIAACYGEK